MLPVMFLLRGFRFEPIYFIIFNFKTNLENICKKSKLKMKLYVFGVALYTDCHLLNLQV